MKLFIFALVSGRQRRAGGKNRPVPQNGPFPVNDPDVGISSEQGLHFRFNPAAIGAVVVEEFDNRDIAIRIAQNGRIGIIFKRGFFRIENLRCGLRLQRLLLLFEQLRGLEHDARILADGFQHQFLDPVFVHAVCNRSDRKH